ncbi:hypothetical protein H310_01989 [Aphanomyces invadans]|uniref:Uncharacterized protein n=1 Tax=Aphanomyces invadans TaxID=157072 RepID=A0A024UMU2_9STRA|nr:hypothetical protein H310_01989 [Aphanomyces invadans]ETW07480.1 hypothetical protein H310_01989 [Aphanomyces invadans]|eukprot:XP_008863573.1 hypothetical protein H310_01989 [Aphanomyces invadans]
MEFAMSFVRPDMQFNDLLNYVHIDEKWFYLTKTIRTYCFVPGESEAERKCMNKRFLTKVMFLTAVARLRYAMTPNHGGMPPNFPDTNILDLGFFASLQSLQYQKSARLIDELVLHVHEAFNVYPYDSLDRTFLTLQCCFVEILKTGGDNTYKLPHMSRWQDTEAYLETSKARGRCMMLVAICSR